MASEQDSAFSLNRKRWERELMEQLQSLQHEDETLYSMLAVDIWALAKTIDEFQPGFWSAFMKNREKALKQFLEDVNKRREMTQRLDDALAFDTSNSKPESTEPESSDYPLAND